MILNWRDEALLYMHRKLESAFSGATVDAKRFFGMAIVQGQKPQPSIVTQNSSRLRHEVLRVKNFDRCQRKRRYVASLKFSSNRKDGWRLTSITW